MSGNHGRGQPPTGQRTCRCDCRQCHFGYHCSPCSRNHWAAMGNRGGRKTGRRNMTAPALGRYANRPRQG